LSTISTIKNSSIKRFYLDNEDSQNYSEIGGISVNSCEEIINCKVKDIRINGSNNISGISVRANLNFDSCLI